VHLVNEEYAEHEDAEAADDGYVLIDHRIAALLRAVDRLTQDVVKLSVAVESSRQIGTAVGVLMERHQITQKAAFALLAHAGQKTHRKLRDVAADVELLGTIPD
jgi:AmiR/NasT family two-component response regulator